jgi:hypothetical protein
MLDVSFSPEDEPLKVQVVGGRLVITIGIACLAHAIEFDPSLSLFNEETGEFEYPEVTDPLVFAQAIDCALSQEEEDGSTPVHRMLDKAALDAIESGAEGVHCPGD